MPKQINDYFEHTELVPMRVLRQLQKPYNPNLWPTEQMYIEWQLDQLRPMGWEFDYDMGLNLYNLRPVVDSTIKGMPYKRIDAFLDDKFQSYLFLQVELAGREMSFRIRLRSDEFEDHVRETYLYWDFAEQNPAELVRNERSGQRSRH